MSDRSELISKVLETWDYSAEGQGYLEWLVKPESKDIDGGDLLREAVLDIMEEDDQLKSLREERAAVSWETFYESLPSEVANKLRAETKGLLASLSGIKESFRQKAEHLRKLRHLLKRDRLETLTIVSQIQSDIGSDEITAFHKNSAIAEEMAAKIAALNRTSTERLDIAADLQSFSMEDTWIEIIHKLAASGGEDWFDYNREKLDRYFAQQLVAKLEKNVERASSLDTVNLKVTNPIIRKLFNEAHEAFLYGFDIGSIALCRSLVDHALKDKLAPPRGKQELRLMIEQAKKDRIFDSLGYESAEKVRHAGNRIMHEISDLRSTSREVLDCTRIVLNKLYSVT